MNQIAIAFNYDDEALLSGLENDLKKLNLRIVDRTFNKITRAPLLILETNAADTIAAEIMARRLIAAYCVPH